jgi:hypothetical protein
VYCTQARIDQLTAEIAAISTLIVQLAHAPTTVESKVISYTVNGRQVTLKSSADPGQAIPTLRHARDSMLVDLARCEAGGIPLFYGVPR